jgi:hypothetical protein
MDNVLPCDSLSGLFDQTCLYQRLSSGHQWWFYLSIMSNVLFGFIYNQLYPARWQIKGEGLTRILQRSAKITVALSSMVKDLCLGGIWFGKNLLIIDIEYSVEIGGNNCAV